MGVASFTVLQHAHLTHSAPALKGLFTGYGLPSSRLTGGHGTGLSDIEASSAEESDEGGGEGADVLVVHRVGEDEGSETETETESETEDAESSIEELGETKGAEVSEGEKEEHPLLTLYSSLGKLYFCLMINASLSLALSHQPEIVLLSYNLLSSKQGISA